MSNTTLKYNVLEINGLLKVLPVTPKDVKGERLSVHLLMGPTGSGKSTFIESLSPFQELGISKNSLESVTQEVVCYRVVGLTHGGWNALLVDTPGFLDTKLAECRITKMITDTLDRLHQSASAVYVSIYYFQPITDIRMGGSKRDAVKLLKAFTESFGADKVTVVTTMWNQISSSKKMEDANQRFSDLKNEIFKSSDEFDINVIKLEFSNDSAVSTLDKMHPGWPHQKDKSRKMNPNYQSLILNNLLERISNIQQQLLILAEDKRNATTPGREDPLLLDIVLRDEKVALGALQSFLDDIYEINPEAYLSLPLPLLPLHVALKHKFRCFVVAGKRVFRKHKQPDYVL